jgi:hypothetical protein
MVGRVRRSGSLVSGPSARLSQMPPTVKASGPGGVLRRDCMHLAPVAQREGSGRRSWRQRGRRRRKQLVACLVSDGETHSRSSRFDQLSTALATDSGSRTRFPTFPVVRSTSRFLDEESQSSLTAVSGTAAQSTVLNQCRTPIAGAQSWRRIECVIVELTVTSTIAAGQYSGSGSTRQSTLHAEGFSTSWLTRRATRHESCQTLCGAPKLRVAGPLQRMRRTD